MIMKLDGNKVVEQNREAYNIIAAPYGRRIEELVEDSWIATFTESLQDAFLEQILRGDKARILEIGPGNGSAAQYFLSKGASVTGIDISVKMMEQAMIKAPRASFFQMDMRRITLPSGTFDGVWADGCIYHVVKKDIPRVFKGVHRVLKENGIFFFNFKFGEGEVLEDDPKSFGWVPRFYAYYSLEEMVEIVEKAGFKIMLVDFYPEEVLGEKIVCISARKN